MPSLKTWTFRAAVATSNWLATVQSIVGIPAVCALYIRAGGQEGRLTLLLSVAALTFSQIVMFAARRRDAALHGKLDEILAALPGARDDLMHLEDRCEAEIEELRR